MPMKSNKYTTESIERMVTGSLNRFCIVYDFKKKDWMNSVTAVYLKHNGLVKGPGSSSDKYGIFLHGGGNELDFITSSDDINEIKVYMLGMITGSEYK